MPPAEVLGPDGAFNEEHYRLIRKLSFSDLPDFVFEQIRKINRVTVTYYVALLALFLPTVLYPILGITTPYPVYQWVLFSALGFVIFPLLLIPLHEAIHGLFYLLAGARNIKAGANFRLFFFYVSADREAVNMKWFRLIAWAPGVILTVLILLFALNLNTAPLLTWSLLICAFVHFTMCIGDAAMAGFIHDINDPDLLTMDDLTMGMAYFYIPKAP